MTLASFNLLLSACLLVVVLAETFLFSDMERTWTLWAHRCEPGRDGRGAFRHIGSRRYVELHLLQDPIVQVEVTEDPAGDYWGWLATGETKPSMIWPSEAQFRICFPYGPEVEVEKGKGEILRLRVAPK